MGREANVTMNATAVRPPWNATGGIPLNVTLHGWPVPPPEPDTKTPLPEQEPSKTNTTARVINFNATGFVALDEDISEPGFSDAQTLVLAGVGTLLTLVLAVGVVLGVRILWQRYQTTKDEGYEGVLQREESSEPGRRTTELKTSESQFTAATSEDQTSPTVLTPKSNGSVITMTLKNNHLIVETEEGTCTSPSVRVDSRGSTTTYVTSCTPEFQGEGQLNAHGALIHRPPDELDDEEKLSSQTGLSQSDLSMSSSGSQNLSYRYGNQTAYESGGYGYSETSYEPSIRPSHSGSREFAKYTRSPSQMDRTDSVVSASDVNMFLRSDVSARSAALERKRVSDDGDHMDCSDKISNSNPPTANKSANEEKCAESSATTS